MEDKALPELVAPAGNLEKLKTAFAFGADAVYIGGHEYSLRAAADNFSLEEMAQGLEIAHSYGGKVYVTVNIFARNQDLEKMPPYLRSLQEIGVDGIIVSDPGILLLAREYCPRVPVTISTQANVTNCLSADFYYRQGAKRLVLARELSMQEIAEIKSKVPLELEVFVHGAMCLSYSGRCWLSLAMTGRDANRGECAHPCRYRYSIQEEKRPGRFFPVEEDQRGTYVMNSKDLCLVEYIPQLIELGIDAFKIEGRMKSPYYVAAVVRVYREAIDYALQGLPPDHARWVEELTRISNRPLTSGFILSSSQLEQDAERQQLMPPVLFCGVVKDRDHEGGRLLLEQRAPFKPGDQLEILDPKLGLARTTAGRLFNLEMQEVDVARHAKEMLWMDTQLDISPGALLGKVEN